MACRAGLADPGYALDTVLLAARWVRVGRAIVVDRCVQRVPVRSAPPGADHWRDGDLGATGDGGRSVRSARGTTLLRIDRAISRTGRSTRRARVRDAATRGRSRGDGADLREPLDLIRLSGHRFHDEAGRRL